MLKRLAPLVPIALSMVLAACANHSPQPQPELAAQPAVFSSTALAEFDEQAKEAALGDFTEEKSYKLPQLADSILSHGLSLVGTRYRFGGGSVSSGFDCSGFIGYLFKEEAGMQLPRSSRDMINIDAPRWCRVMTWSRVICCSSAPMGVIASATPASTWAITSSSTPAAAAAVVCGSTAWKIVTGNVPLSKPSVPWRWRQVTAWRAILEPVGGGCQLRSRFPGLYI